MTRRTLAGSLLIGAVGLGWIGCGSGGGSGDPGGSGGAGVASSGAGSPTGTSTGGGVGSGGGTAATPIFEKDVVPIFLKSCGTADNACHSRVAYAADSTGNCRGWLSLEDAPLGSQIYGGPDDGKPTMCPDMPLYERLTQLDAWQCGNNLIRYVKPCKPDESYIIHKTDSGPLCEKSPGKISDSMPPNKPMDAGELAILKAWIEAGAPRENGDKVDCGGGAGGAGGAGGGGNGSAPQAKINHPGDMEKRFVSNGAFPFIGVATDAEDGSLSGASLVWTSDKVGQIGTGAQFDYLPPVGTHVITLTVTDSDKNTGSDSITITMAP